MMKQIKLQTKLPIEIDPASLLETVNRLRKDYGEKKKDKLPVELDKILSKINLFKNRDSENGMLSFRLSYEDAEGGPCTRNFPNFGLDIKSDSILEQKYNKLFLSVSMTVKAGKAKWQREEILECGAILESRKFKLTLEFTLDETTEWAGHSASVNTTQDVADSRGVHSIPESLFIVEIQ